MFEESGSLGLNKVITQRRKWKEKESLQHHWLIRQQFFFRTKTNALYGSSSYCNLDVTQRKPKVLLMDEATASIDEKTDEMIQ